MFSQSALWGWLHPEWLWDWAEGRGHLVWRRCLEPLTLIFFLSLILSLPRFFSLSPLQLFNMILINAQRRNDSFLILPAASHIIETFSMSTFNIKANFISAASIHLQRRHLRRSYWVPCFTDEAIDALSEGKLVSFILWQKMWSFHKYSLHISIFS